MYGNVKGCVYIYIYSKSEITFWGFNYLELLTACWSPSCWVIILGAAISRTEWPYIVTHTHAHTHTHIYIYLCTHMLCVNNQHIYLTCIINQFIGIISQCIYPAYLLWLNMCLTKALQFPDQQCSLRLRGVQASLHLAMWMTPWSPVGYITIGEKEN